MQASEQWRCDGLHDNPIISQDPGLGGDGADERSEEGNSLEFETTVFVPILPAGVIWDRPNFIGLNNFVNRMRFAVDATENVFYFGLA